MTKVIAQNIQEVFGHREKIALFLILVILASSVSYVVFLQRAIKNVVAREQILKQVQAENTSVSSLENQYFSLETGVTEQFAYSKGFKDATVKTFISGKSGQALTFNNDL